MCHEQYKKWPHKSAQQYKWISCSQMRYDLFAQKQVHLMPDWWGVSETNHNGARNLFGNIIGDVLSNVESFSAQYIIVNTSIDGNDQLIHKCNDYFEIVSKFDWTDYETLFGFHTPWPHNSEPPIWRKTQLASIRQGNYAMPPYRSNLSTQEQGVLETERQVFIIMCIIQ